jgi:hypothetical protein
LASIRRQADTYEIRECRSTERGPRQYTLARFKKVLTPEVLDEAAARAQRPFDPQALVAGARARGIAVTPHRSYATARRLLGELRGGRPLEPSLVALLRRALAGMNERPLPPHLTDAAEWLARSEASRGKALRGLLRAASRVARSRGPRRDLPAEPFPRFSSGQAAFPAR